MTCPNGKEWLVKCGWQAHFQDSRGYFTTRWIAFAVDNELKVDSKLLFTITSLSKIDHCESSWDDKSSAEC
jgi:hypothetical protein